MHFPLGFAILFWNIKQLNNTLMKSGNQDSLELEVLF